MSAHTCTELTDGCYRCDLNRDEINAYRKLLVVTRKGVVHDPDCSYVSGVCSSAIPWTTRVSTDRACGRCLEELP